MMQTELAASLFDYKDEIICGVD
ncbi:MAG: hypothetical protein RIR02_1075, partial [Pseudomonadota bacterium]